MRTKPKKREGRPCIMFRADRKTARRLNVIARETGYADRSAFLREFCEAMVSDDLEKIHGFASKCSRKIIERAQAQLPLLAAEPTKRGRAG